MKKRIFSVFLAAVLLFTGFNFAFEKISAANPEIIEFPCGLNATAYFETSTGTLTVKGTGEMRFFYDEVPWWVYRNQIKLIVVEEGITRIAECAFLDTNATKIYLPASLEEIALDALSMMIYNEEIIIPENSKLSVFERSSYYQEDPWYVNQPDGPVYVGNMLLEYKGTMPANTTITVREGTYAINKYAFRMETNLVDVIVPDTVERIGYRAFYGTAWINEQPYYEPIYLGKVFYCYNFPWRAIQASDIKEELVISDGIVSISSGAFNGQCTFRNVVLPESLEHIGSEAFVQCFYLEKITVPENSRLEQIDNIAFYECSALGGFDFPEGFKRLGINVFMHCGLLEEVYLPASVENMGLTAFEPNSLDSFTVDPDNPYYCTDEDGILYSKDKTAIYASYQKMTTEEFIIPETVTKIGAQAFAKSSVKKFVIPDSVNEIGFESFTESAIERVKIPYGVKRIQEYAFCNCDNLTEVELSKTVNFIDTAAFKNSDDIKKIIIPAEVSFIAGDAFENCDEMTIYCYEDTAAYYHATENEFLYYILDVPDMTELDALLDEYAHLNRERYYEDSLVAYDEAVSAVDMKITVITQDMVDSWVSGIEAAKEQMVYIPADYSAVDEALSKANAIDRSLYTDESLAKLDAAVNSVEENLDVTNQEKIEFYAKSINDAVELLKFRPADFSKLDNAVKNAELVNRSLYTAESLARLDVALAKVDYTATIDRQSAVDAWATEIENAIKALEYAEADLSVVDALVSKADKLDRSLYTEESLAVLDDAIAQVDYNITKEHQTKVAVWAKSIDDALKNLKYKIADYSKVNEAVSKAGKLDKLLYTSSTYTAVEQSVSAVAYGLDITKQAEVDAFAKKINDSITALEYAEVVLRNEPNGVIVSATAKEIYPTTELTVDKIDPSGFETADFAIGGHIKSVNYYDITLVLNSEKVQPNGTVFVKIKIPEGVTPEKCRVYHVTEDPVDPLVRFSSTLDGHYIVFETDHFSEFAVIEFETVLEEIKITKLPSKTVYTAGEMFDAKGMTVTAVMSDGEEIAVSDYDISGVDMSEEGKKKVTVYCTVDGVTKSASFEITVNAKAAETTTKPAETTKPEPATKPQETVKPSVKILVNGEDKSEYTKKVTWYKGYSSETLSLGYDSVGADGYAVKWSSDNSKVTVDENGKIANKGFFFPRKAVITLELTDSQGNTVAKDSVILRYYKFSFQLGNLQNNFVASLKKTFLNLVNG